MVPAGLVMLFVSLAMTGLVVWLYMRATFRLLERVQREELELWDALGQPQRVWVRGEQSGSGGGFSTIQPILPWLGWILGGGDLPVGRETAGARRTVRMFLLVGTVFFAVSVVLIVGL